MLGALFLLVLITNSVHAELYPLKDLADAEADKVYTAITWLYLIQNQDSLDDYGKIDVNTGSTLKLLIEDEPTTFDGEINAYKAADTVTIKTCADTFCKTLTGYIYSTVARTNVKQYVISPQATPTRYSPNSNSYFAFFPYSNTSSQLYVKFEDFKYPVNSTIQFYLDDAFTNLAFDVTEYSSNISSPDPTLVFPLTQVFLKTTGPGIQFNASLISDVPQNITKSSGSFIMTNMYPAEITEQQNFTIPFYSGNYLDIELTLERNDSIDNTIRVTTKHTDVSLDQNTKKLRIQLDSTEDHFYVETQRPMYMKYSIVNGTVEEEISTTTIPTTTTTTKASENGTTVTSTTMETTTKHSSNIEFIRIIISTIIILLVV